MVLPSPNACSKESSCIFAELRFAPFNEEPSNMLVLYTFKISSSFFSFPSLFVRSLKVILCLLDNKFAQRKSAFSKFACFKTVLFKSPLCNLAFCKSAPSKCAPRKSINPAGSIAICLSDLRPTTVRAICISSRGFSAYRVS